MGDRYPPQPYTGPAQPYTGPQQPQQHQQQQPYPAQQQQGGYQAQYNQYNQNPHQQPYQPHHQPQHQAPHPPIPQAEAAAGARPRGGAYGGGARGSLVPKSDFHAIDDAKKLRKAIKGLGTDDKTLIAIVTSRTQVQRLQIEEAYRHEFRRDLLKDIEGDTSGMYRTALKAAMRSPPQRSAAFIHKAVDGWGTDNWLLIETFATKEAWEIKDVKEAYGIMYPKSDMVKDVLGDTSGDFRHLLEEIMKGKRAPNTAPGRPQECAHDAKVLYKAGEKKWGTDEDKFIDIFATRSYPQLRMIAEEYKKISKKTLREAISSEMSGNIKNFLKALFDYATDPAGFFAKRLYKSMHGIGTKDWSLIQIIVERSELDMEIIKAKFMEVYERKLEEWVHEDTSGNYRKVLLALVGKTKGHTVQEK